MGYTKEDLADLLYDLSDMGMESTLEMEAVKTGKFEHINVDRIWPEPKDMKRAKDLAKLPKGIDAGGPLQSKANPQAGAITNSAKLVRRAKAVVATWGTGEHETVRGVSNAWKPFKQKLTLEGFSASQIEKIANFKF